MEEGEQALRVRHTDISQKTSLGDGTIWRTEGAAFAKSSALAFSIADPFIRIPKVGEVLSMNKYIFQVAETYTPEVIYIYMQNARFREVK